MPRYSAACNAINVFSFAYFSWEVIWLDSSPWQVKQLVRRNKVCCLTDDRPLSWVTYQPVQCLTPSIKLTYIRLSTQILLCCSGCQKTIPSLTLQNCDVKVYHWFIECRPCYSIQLLHTVSVWFRVYLEHFSEELETEIEECEELFHE